MTDFEQLLDTLGKHKVEFILVGGAAAIAHGSARLTAKHRSVVLATSKRSPS